MIKYIILFALMAMAFFYVNTKVRLNEKRLNQTIDLIETQNHKINKDSILYEVNLQRAKENYYTTQLTIQSDWIILYVTVLFGIFGLLGYTAFEMRIVKVERDAENKIAEHKRKYEKHLKDFNSVKYDVYDTIGSFYYLFAHDLRTKNLINSELLEILLTSIIHSNKSVQFARDTAHKQEILNGMAGTMDEIIADIRNMISDEDDIHIHRANIRKIDKLRDFMYEISKIENKEIHSKYVTIMHLLIHADMMDS